MAAVQSCKITNNESRPAGVASRPIFLKPDPEQILLGLLRSPRIDSQPDGIDSWTMVTRESVWLLFNPARLPIMKIVLPGLLPGQFF